MQNTTYVIKNGHIRFFNPRSCTNEGAREAANVLELQAQRAFNLGTKFSIHVDDKNDFGYGVNCLEFNPVTSAWELRKYHFQSCVSCSVYPNALKAVLAAIEVLGYNDDEYHYVDAWG